MIVITDASQSRRASPPRTITVALLSGRRLHFSLDPDVTFVVSLKEQVASLLGAEVQDLTLVGRGVPLQNDQVLGACVPLVHGVAVFHAITAGRPTSRPKHVPAPIVPRKLP